MPIFYPVWTNTEKQIVVESMSKLSYRKICDLLPGRTLNSIKQRATLLGLHRDRHVMCHLGQKKIGVNEEFFERKTLTSAYWAGFIAADGCVLNNPRFEVRLWVHEKDRIHIERFVADTGYHGQIKLRKGESVIGVTVSGVEKWVVALQKIYSIGPKKTWFLVAPNLEVPEELEFVLAYIRGYIDGDGCWATSQSRGGKRRLHLVLVGTQAILVWIVKMLSLIVGSQIIREPRLNKGCFKYTLSGKLAEQVAEVLSSLIVPRLDRKWNIADGFCDRQLVRG